MLDTSDLLRTGEMLKALFYILLSVTAGFILFRIGAAIGQSV
jgi:fluoride ion exporter CrcB/FEX